MTKKTEQVIEEVASVWIGNFIISGWSDNSVEIEHEMHDFEPDKHKRIRITGKEARFLSGFLKAVEARAFLKSGIHNRKPGHP
jgi:hypothetical protein